MTTPPLPTDADRPDRDELKALIGDPTAETKPEPPGEGLSVLDLAALPSAQLRVMRVLLRGVELSYEALCAAIDNLPQTERLSRSELDAALRVLLEQQWLVRTESNTPYKYKANLHRKSNRTISEFAPPRSRRQGSTLRNVWDSLEKSDKA
jgi:hypothetical protein